MSDLREALEEALERELCLCEQCEDGDKYNDGVRAVRAAVRKVLSAHPAEPAPVANRERVAEALAGHDVRYIVSAAVPRWFCPCGNWETLDVETVVAGHATHLSSVLLAAGVFRDEAEVKAEVAEKIAEFAEEAADDLEPPTTSEWLELRDWFKDQLHALAAKAREAGGIS